MTAPREGIDLRLLGRVRARRDGVEIALGAARRAAVFAVLALHANHRVSRDDLVAEVWGARPPASATETVYTYVSALRRALDPDRRVLTSGAGGYCLHVDEDDVDAFRFEALRERGRGHRVGADPAAERAALAEALALWQGEALLGVPGPFAEAQRLRLGELRLATMERHAALLVELGRRDEAIAELRGLVERHPLQERPHAMLMGALHAGGRTVEALGVHDQLRDLLVDQLGTEPGDDLRSVRGRILAEVGGAPAAPGGPAALVGRDAEASLLRRAVAPAGCRVGRAGGDRARMHGSASDPLRVSVLGPPRAWIGDRELSLGQARQRTVFAVLAAGANRPVDTGELIGAVWGAAPPATATGSVYTYVSGLRRVLGPRRAALASRPAGYLLELGPGALDSDRFAELCAEAARAKDGGDLAIAKARLDEALGLWHGEAYAGLPGDRLDAERAHLAGRRLAAVELRARIAVDLGDDGLVAELARQVRAHPLHEPLHEVLMLALHRAGRPADALAAFRAARRTLVAELGVEPGVALRRLHRQILDGSVPAGRVVVAAGADLAFRHPRLRQALAGAERSRRCAEVLSAEEKPVIDATPAPVAAGG